MPFAITAFLVLVVLLVSGVVAVKLKQRSKRPVANDRAKIEMEARKAMRDLRRDADKRQKARSRSRDSVGIDNGSNESGTWGGAGGYGNG